MHLILFHFRKVNSHKMKKKKIDTNVERDMHLDIDYLMPLESIDDSSADMISNLSLVALVSEQMVTVGNGTDEMGGISRPVKMSETGLLCHFIQIF